MGASESKLVFKQGIFRLSEDQAIPAGDPCWKGFWELPESVEDVFSLFSPADIRRTRDSSLANLETLLVEVTARLTYLRNHPSFPDPDLAPERDALNCIRVLTRVLPYVYEADHLADWEEKLFWSTRHRKTRRAQVTTEVLFDEAHDNATENPRPEEDEVEETKPLAEELMDTLTDLLFFTNFTIPVTAGSKDKVTYAIWQSGVGCKTSIGSNKELERNRCEVLRLLLTVTSKSIYMSPALLPVQGVKAITYLVTCPDKQLALSVLCSLLNTVIKYNAASWKVPYDHVVWKDPKQTLVVYSLQFLLVLLLYPVPEGGRGPPAKNYYRSWLGKLHRPEDFQFISEGMTRVLSQPMQASLSYLPGSQKSVRWAPEIMMLFWETLQCNKRFRTFIIDSKRAQDFVVLCLFYAIESKTDPSRQGVVKMCVFILQTLSVEPGFGKSLNRKFDAQDTLPPVMRIPNLRGSFADFLIISIHILITGSMGKLDAIYPALLATINNVAPYVTHLSSLASSKLLQLFASMSSPSFLLANEINHTLLQSLLGSINSIIENHYTENPNLIYAVLKSRKRIQSLRAFTLETGQQEMEKMARRRKEGSSDEAGGASPDPRSPSTRHASLSNVPEDGTFAIGDSEDDSDNESNEHTPVGSRAPSLASTDDSVPIQLRGMSEKARGKMPINSPSFSRRDSSSSAASYSGRAMLSPTAGQSITSNFTPTTHWIESWLPEVPLHTTLTLIKALGPHLASLTSSSSTTEASPNTSTRVSASTDNNTTSTTPTINTHHFICTLPSTATDPLIRPLLINPPDSDNNNDHDNDNDDSSTTTHKIHSFTWSPLSLGWYESLLWSLIFASEMLVGSNTSSSSSAAAAAVSSTTSSIATNLTFLHGAATSTGSGTIGGRNANSNPVAGAATATTTAAISGGTIGAVGVWNGTNVRLFGVKEGVKEGPTLMRPKGAVDAVGNRIVRGLGGLRLGEIGNRVLSGGGGAIASAGGTSTSTGIGGGSGGGESPSVREI